MNTPAALDLSRSNSLADLAGRIGQAHREAQSAMRTSMVNALIAGELLIEAKRQVPHGQWLPWLRSACHLSERTAQAYMRLARKLPELDQEKRTGVALLSLREANKAIAAPRKLPAIPEPPPPVSPIPLEELGRPIHPACAILPMVSDQELGCIVASIREIGLLHPITVDKSGAVVDGKIRLMACKIAGVEPRFEVLGDDTDPFDFMMSMNIYREHRTNTQRALRTARVLLQHPESVPAWAIVNRTLTEEAVFVLRQRPDLFTAIYDGLPFGSVRDAIQADEERRETEARTMAALCAEAPDLWDAVHEGKMPLEEAVAAAEDRAERARVGAKLDAMGDLLKAMATETA